MCSTMQEDYTEQANAVDGAFNGQSQRKYDPFPTRIILDGEIILTYGIAISLNKAIKADNSIPMDFNPNKIIKQDNWCEPRDHVVTQPTIKIEFWSRKAEIGLIGVWHNGNLPQGTNTIGLSRMTPRSQLIFDKSDSVCSRTEECKNHSHTLKLKNSEVIIIQAAEILAYMSLNSSWKVNPNGPLMWT